MGATRYLGACAWKCLAEYKTYYEEKDSQPALPASLTSLWGGEGGYGGLRREHERYYFGWGPQRQAWS